MKFIKTRLLLVISILGLLVSCSEELDLEPQGVITTNQILESESKMESSLIGVYAALSQQNTRLGDRGSWLAPPSNWVYGDVPSDDAYKGSTAADQGPLLEIEQFTHNASNPYFDTKWRALYEGVSRANKFLKLIKETNAVSSTRKTSMTAETRFLRAHFYFELYKTFKNVPYLDETTKDPLQLNKKDILPKIIEDLQYAKDNLPNDQSESGRPTSYAAASYLGKVYLYKACYETDKYTSNLNPDGSDFTPSSVASEDFQKAKDAFLYVQSSGKYTLLKEFEEIYNPSKKSNNTEAIFSIKNSVKDGTPNGRHGNLGDLLNHVQGGPGGEDANGCCGFFVPSENLANSYKTKNGLPIDSFTGNASNEFNDDNATGGNMSDFGIKSEDPFTLYSGQLDPRIDFTIGRRGIPFADYGLHPGQKWSRAPKDQGNYTRKKRYITKADYAAGYGEKPIWYVATAIDYHVIRYADVLLMLAECDVELGNLNDAKDLVNEIRNRAKKSTYTKALTGVANAANYDIELYTTFTNKTQARAAVRFERRLELALEGHRFFDLVRWGIAEKVINIYKAGEPVSYTSNIQFKASKNEFQPIPQNQIDLSQKNGKSVLEQNRGY